ncbi:MAG: hypothetical protein PHS71_04375 [Proteiniphilum sp.]|nr:hypothetical protein [Proteiniphilum sp.]
MLDRHPKAVSDSLKTLDRNALSRSGKAYYDLLKVISDDKTYVNFTSDSLINAVSRYYKSYDSQNMNYIRALAYQGIVRTRMGVKDSTVYEPLREANRLFQVSTQPDASIGYMINYFLGNIHYNNRNFSSADDYFYSALTYAEQEKDSVHRFDSYLALYWNQMGQKDFKKSKLYLDTLSTYYNQLPGKDYFILNAQSIYYDIIGEPEKALEKEKEKSKLYNKQNEKIELSRVYFNISNIYLGLEQLDSALLYARASIELIDDPSYRQNYLYYQNLAHISEKMGDFALSNQYLKKSMEMHQLSLRERLDVQIAEMEKKYDLSEAENEVLRARAQTSKTIIAALILGMILVVMSMYAFWNRRNTHLKLLHAEHQVKQQQLQADLLKEEAAKRKWLLQLYSNISDRLTFLQNEFEQLAQRYISANPKVHREMLRILKNTDTDLRDITKTLSPDDETFYAYTRLKNEDDFFSTNEKLLLMLLTCDADNRQLATFMNTSIDSIRVRKSQLKKKMLENGLNTAIFSD